MVEDLPNENNTVEATVYLSPDLADSSDLAETDLVIKLGNELRTVGFPAYIQVHDALAIRGAVAHEIWVTLSSDGTLVLLGAAGAGLWEAVANVFGRLFSGRGGRCTFALKMNDQTTKVDLDLSGSATEITETLRTLPDVLRSTKDSGEHHSASAPEQQDETKLSATSSKVLAP